jgi:hypothetical protein
MRPKTPCRESPKSAFCSPMSLHNVCIPLITIYISVLLCRCNDVNWNQQPYCSHYMWHFYGTSLFLSGFLRTWIQIQWTLTDKEDFSSDRIFIRNSETQTWKNQSKSSLLSPNRNFLIASATFYHCYTMF